MGNLEDHFTLTKSDRFKVIAINAPGMVKNTGGNGFLLGELGDVSLPWTPCPRFSTFSEKVRKIRMNRKF